MRNNWLILLFVFLPNVSFATTIGAITARELANEAELVFEGRVSSVEPFWRGEYIFTRVSFQILDIVVGEYREPSIELVFAGGTINAQRFSVGAVIPREGEHGVYFVEDMSRSLLNPLLGWSQGHFVVEDDQVVAADRAVVTRVTNESRRSDMISDNVADGVYTRRSAPSYRALSVDDFKAEIVNLRGE